MTLLALTQQIKYQIIYYAHTIKGTRMERKYMSFFSGALGLDIGLENAGLEAVSYNEIEKVFCNTIRQNRPDTKL